MLKVTMPYKNWYIIQLLRNDFGPLKRHYTIIGLEKKKYKLLE